MKNEVVKNAEGRREGEGKGREFNDKGGEYTIDIRESNEAGCEWLSECMCGDVRVPIRQRKGSARELTSNTVCNNKRQTSKQASKMMNTALPPS